MNHTNTLGDKGLEPPKLGDVFQCKACGMELKVTKECGCKPDEHVHFHCCGKEMVKV